METAGWASHLQQQGSADAFLTRYCRKQGKSRHLQHMGHARRAPAIIQPQAGEGTCPSSHSLHFPRTPAPLTFVSPLGRGRGAELLRGQCLCPPWHPGQVQSDTGMMHVSTSWNCIWPVHMRNKNTLACSKFLKRPGCHPLGKTGTHHQARQSIHSFPLCGLTCTGANNSREWKAGPKRNGQKRESSAHRHGTKGYGKSEGLLRRYYKK